MGKNSVSDTELLREAAEGDARSKDQLIRRYLPLAQWHARHYARTVSQYDDFRQEAMLGLMRAIDTFRFDAGVQFNTYATTCMTNALITHQRKLKRNQEFTVSVGEQDEVFERLADNSESGILDALYINDLRESLAQKLSKLELESLFYHAEGYSYKEIASFLEVSTKQVANALSRAHIKLKKS